MAFLLHFCAMGFVCYNGEMFDEQQPLITLQNNSFKFGEALFETMRVTNGVAPLATLHFERLQLGMQFLQLSFPTETTIDVLLQKIYLLCARNNCSHAARVRLSVFRKNNTTGYAIEAVPLPQHYLHWNDEGLQLTIYPHARKAIDDVANFKTANYLPYLLAAQHAAEKKMDESLIRNSDNAICDCSKANIFLIKGNEIFTPGLHQGCIAGVMRRALIDVLKKIGRTVQQTTIADEDIAGADEVFLTNALFGIRWVRQFEQHQYNCTVTKKIYTNLLPTIFV